MKKTVYLSRTIKCMGLFLALIMLIATLGIFSITANAANGNLCEKSNCTGTYKNGFCSECNGGEIPEIGEDGYCLIDNAGKLYNWVNGNGTPNYVLYMKNARLTADIVVNENVIVNGELNTDAKAVESFREWKSDSVSAGLIFDGQGHTISGLYTASNEGVQSTGLFSTIEVQATVQNVGVVDSYFSSVNTQSQLSAGAIAKNNQGTIINCFSNAVLVVDAYSKNSVSTVRVGGIVGRNTSTGKVENCYFTGRIGASAKTEGTELSHKAIVYAGGIVGDNDGAVRNCFSTGLVASKGVTATDPSRESEYVGEVIGYIPEEGTVNNCYYLAMSESDEYDGTTFKTDAQFKSGEVAYLLNNEVTDGKRVFYQTVGEGLPTFSGDTVYRYPHCDGVGVVYSNYATIQHQQEIVEEDYFNEDGICKVCGEQASVKVVTVDMIIGSTVISKTNYFCDMNAAFASDNVINTTAIPAQITLLEDVALDSAIEVGGGCIIFDAQTYRIEKSSNSLLPDVFHLTNGASLTLKGNGVIKGTVNVSNSTFIMTDGSIEAETAIRYSNPVAISIIGGSIIGKFDDVKSNGSSVHPIISGVFFPNGVTLESASSVTISDLLDEHYYLCDENGSVIKTNVKSISVSAESKNLEDILNDIRDSVTNGEDGKTPTFKVEKDELKVSYDNGATWTALGNIHGADGKEGMNGITPQLRVSSETNVWEVSYDNGITWTSLGVKATGEKGAQGIQGEKGDTVVAAADGKDGANGLTVTSIVIGSMALVSNISLIAYMFFKKKKTL